MKKLIFALAAVQMLLSGCAIGNKYDYRSQTLDLPVASGGSVAVAVSDQRPYVVSGDKTAVFVGLQRAGFGIPHDVETLSQGPLADDFAATISAALEAKGIAVKPVMVAPSVNDRNAVKALSTSGADKALLILLREWKSDTMNNVALMYDVKAEVFDGQGNSIAENAVVGRENLGGDAWNPPKHARSAVPAAYRRILETLLSDPKIVDALK